MLRFKRGWGEALMNTQIQRRWGEAMMNELMQKEWGEAIRNTLVQNGVRGRNKEYTDSKLVECNQQGIHRLKSEAISFT